MKPRFQCPLDRRKTERLFQLGLILANLFFFIALAVYAWRGFSSRYWADDYCFGAIFRQQGLLAGTRYFYENTSNRFSAFFVVGLAESLGVNFMPFLPALMILLTVVIYTRVFDLAFHLIKFPQNKLSSLLLGQALTFFMLLTAPNLFQSVFWRSGMGHYYMPLLFLGIALILLQKALLHGWKWGSLLLLFVITFFSAGLSETYAALETGLWALLVLISLIFQHGQKRKPLLLGAGIALLGSLSAMLIMVKAPGNSMRLETLQQAESLGQIVLLSVRYAAGFAYRTARSFPVPNIILLATMFIFGYHVTGHEKPALADDAWLKILLGSLLLGALLLVCVAAPTAYGMQAYPEERAWMLGRFITVMTLIVAGFSAGVRSHRYMDRIVDTCLMSILILMLLSAYPLKAAWNEWQMIPQWQATARAWDERQSDILEKVEAGETALIVPAFDSIGSVAELTDNPDYWVNVCAADFYGVEEITALEDIP